jgi:catechol 2,3-dioxygenase-like lactoylglutathione lyase family enzyme
MTTKTSLVTGVDFAMVPTTDIERSVEFYEGTLGLPCTARYGKVDGAEFETGNLTIAAFDFGAVGMESPSANKGPIAFRVDDVAAAKAELESRGVEFQGDIVDSGVCHQAYFADPDGNFLILHHRYAPRSD